MPRLPECQSARCRRACRWCPECQARSHLHPSSPRWLHCCGWAVQSNSCTWCRDYGAFCRGESQQAPTKPTRVSASLSRSLESEPPPLQYGLQGGTEGPPAGLFWAARPTPTCSSSCQACIAFCPRAPAPELLAPSSRPLVCSLPPFRLQLLSPCDRLHQGSEGDHSILLPAVQADSWPRRGGLLHFPPRASLP